MNLSCVKYPNVCFTTFNISIYIYIYMDSTLTARAIAQKIHQVV